MFSAFALPQPLVSTAGSMAPTVTADPKGKGSSFFNNFLEDVSDIGKSWVNGVLQVDLFKRATQSTSSAASGSNPKQAQQAAPTQQAASAQLVAGVPNVVTYGGMALGVLVILMLLLKLVKG